MQEESLVSNQSAMPATAVVMNMFYTGLGIARCLGERRIPVIGLTAQHGVYGNFTRCAKTLFCPDSRREPEALLSFLIRMGQSLTRRAVLFPTRDDDLVFLDRFRDELMPYFSLVIPDAAVLAACLDKWETYQWAERAGIPTPKSWFLRGPESLTRVLPNVTFPCVLKPLASHHWRRGRNWDIVGARKAIGIASAADLLKEYAAVSRADERALLQEMVAGSDDGIVTAGCYLDAESKWVAGFNIRKLLQVPEGFGTGCIVETVDSPEACALTLQLLQKMHFSGIAEVEYKRDVVDGKLKLIEINPRPWDQHALGKSGGVDLMYLAYCEHAGLKRPVFTRRTVGQKWIAEDALFTVIVRLLWKDRSNLSSLMRLARGKRTYAIWSAKDPLPLLAYLVTVYIPGLITAGVRYIWAKFDGRKATDLRREGKGLVHENLDTRKSLG